MAGDFELFRTWGEVVVIFLGQMGSGGVLASRGKDQWEFFPVESIGWDGFHQEVYRNARADRLTEEMLAEFGIAMPDLGPYRGRHPLRWEDNFPMSIAIEAVPARVRSRLKAGPRSAWLVLMEDRYETSFGDGKFLYPEAAFWAESAASRYVAKIARDEPDPAKRQWYEYTVREVSLHIDPERGAVTAGRHAGRWEHFSVVDVVGLLAKASRWWW